MYGLFPALMETQRFRADQDQRQQEMAMRQQEFGMRQRQMAMQEEQHRLQNQELGLRLGRMKEEDAAGANLADLQKRDVESQQFNGTGLMRPVDDREMNSALGQYAIARRDPAGMVAARNANRMLDVNDEAKKLSQDPEFQAKVMDYVHKDNRFPAQYVPATYDPKTKKQLTPARFDIEGKKPIELSQGDVQQFAYGAALMNKGLTQEGLKHIETINKDLAAMVQRAEQRAVQAGEVNRKETNDLRDNDRGDKQLEAQMAHWKAMEARAGGAVDRRLPPAMLKELSDLEQRYVQADPKERPAIERQYQMALSRAGAAVGKPMGLPNARPPAPEIKVNSDGSVTRGPDLFVPNPKKPGEFIPAKGLGPSALDRALEAYQANTGGAFAPAQQPQGLIRPQRPPGASPDYGVYGTPGYDQYTQDQLLQQIIQNRMPASNLGLQTPMRPVDFSKYNTAPR